MQGNYFLIKKVTHETILNAHKHVDLKVSEITTQGKAAVIKVDEYKSPRSLSANALYWMWCSELSGLFNEKGLTVWVYDDVGGSLEKVDERAWTKDDVHDLLKEMFLGYSYKKVGKTSIKTLKSSRLDTDKFMDYMRKIQNWSIDKLSHHLTDPLESQYREFIEDQNK